MKQENINMAVKAFDAKITHISSEGVQVTGYRLEKPENVTIKDINAYTERSNQFLMNLYNKRFKTYEASKFTAWVENVKKIADQWFLKGMTRKTVHRSYGTTKYKLKLNRSCQVIETGDKVKIIELK